MPVAKKKRIEKHLLGLCVMLAIHVTVVCCQELSIHEVKRWHECYLPTTMLIRKKLGQTLQCHAAPALVVNRASQTNLQRICPLILQEFGLKLGLRGVVVELHGRACRNLQSLRTCFEFMLFIISCM